MRSIVVSLLVVLSFIAASGSKAAEPKVLKIATYAKGSAFYETTTAFHRVLQKNSNLTLEQRPMSIIDAISKMSGSEIDIGFGTASDYALAFRGPTNYKVGGKNPYPHAPTVRLILRGPSVSIGFLTRKDTGIVNTKDIKGRKVAAESVDAPEVFFYNLALTAPTGQTVTDFTGVPVKSVVDGMTQLIGKQIDATVFSVGSPRTADANSLVGVRFVNSDCSADGLKRLGNTILGYRTRLYKKDSQIGMVDDTCVLVFDTYFVTTSFAKDEEVKQMADTILSHADGFRGEHPVLKEWAGDKPLDGSATIPYHPAAVEVLKKKGLWTAEAEAQQKKLLELVK